MAYPYVLFKMQPVSNIGSDPTLLLNSNVACILDSVLISNQTGNEIFITCWVARQVGEEPQADYVFAKAIRLEPYALVDVLNNITLTLEPGDSLYASSDYNDNFFNAFISYRSLTELEGAA